MPAVLSAALRYFALVMGAGFLLGVVRVPWLVPRFGERWAELAEMPVMALVIYAAAGHVLRRYPAIRPAGPALATGGLAWLLLVATELGLTLLLQDQPLRQTLASRDPVSGSVYLGMLVVFAGMPWWRGHADPLESKPRSPTP